jgi:hypothetical protein
MRGRTLRRACTGEPAYALAQVIEVHQLPRVPRQVLPATATIVDYAREIWGRVWRPVPDLAAQRPAFPFYGDETHFRPNGDVSLTTLHRPAPKLDHRHQ